MIKTAVDSNCTVIPKFPDFTSSSGTPMMVTQKTISNVPKTIQDQIRKSYPEYSEEDAELIMPLIEQVIDFNQYIGSQSEKYFIIQGYSNQKKNSFCHYFKLFYGGQKRGYEIVKMAKSTSNIDADFETESFIAITMFDYDNGIKNVQTVSTIKARTDISFALDALAPGLYPYLYGLMSVTTTDTLTPIVADAVEEKYKDIMKQMRFFQYDEEDVLALIKHFKKVGKLDAGSIYNVMQKKCQEKAEEAARKEEEAAKAQK